MKGENIMKIFKKIISTIFIVFILWLTVSYFNILANNTNLDGTPSQFADWNFFTLFVEK